MHAYVYLRTYEVSPAVRKIPPGKRLEYLSHRADRWIERLHRSFPDLPFQSLDETSGQSKRRWANLPATLEVRCPIGKLLQIASSTGVSSVYVSKIAGLLPRRNPKSTLEWYCVRAFVVIRVEGATSGLQSTEDRFVLVRASSFEDAEKRLRGQWIEYASPYLNSDGRIVSWQLDRVVDVYQTGENHIDPAGTEVYSKLNHRRMRGVWRPPRTGSIFRLKSGKSSRKNTV